MKENSNLILEQNHSPNKILKKIVIYTILRYDLFNSKNNC